MKTLIPSTKKQALLLTITMGLLFFFLTSCSQAANPEVLLDVPGKPTVVHVGMTPALDHLKDVFALYSCAAEIEPLIEELPWIRLQEVEKDVYLVYGDEDKDLSDYVYQISESPLVFIVNTDLPIETITIEQLRAIFNGEMTDWLEYAITSSYMGEIQLWGYMEETEIMQAALYAVDSSNSTGQWAVAPTPADVVEMVSQDQNSLGIIPAFALTEEVKELTVTDLELSPIPILAIWDHEPTEIEKDWLQCVQEVMD